MLQAQLDQFPTLRFRKSFHDLAYLPIRMMRTLVEQRGSELNFQRIVVQQINQRRALDGDPLEKVRGDGGQLAASLDFVRAGLRILHQSRGNSNVAQEKLAGALAKRWTFALDLL